MKFFSFLAQYFYSMGLMILLALIALVISLKYHSRHRNLRIFTYYIAFSLLQSMAAFYRYLYPHQQYPVLTENISNFSFMLFEFIICNLFIMHYIVSPVRKLIIRINGLVFFVFLFFLILFFPSINKYTRITSAVFYLLESAFLVLPCLIYFYELFLTVNLRPLRDQPSFWVVTGILFLNTCSIPLLLTVNFLGKYREPAIVLNYILYSTLFILLIRAYLCTPEKLTSGPLNM